MRRAKGLTLIELVVTLACLAIAAAIVIPSVVDRSPEKLRGAAQILIADLEFAQSQSMSHGDNPRVLVIESDNAGYRIATRSTPATAVTHPIRAEPYVVRFGIGSASALTGVTISAYSLGGDDQLGFGTLGQTDQSSPATITLACNGRTLVVTIDSTTGEATTAQIQ